MSNRIAVFIDRDGVINESPRPGEYVTSWNEFQFTEGAIEAIRELSDAGVIVIVVTNQRGIALNRMTESDVRDIHDRMRQALAASNARIHAIYYCPHRENSCECRKPGIGLFLKAKEDFPEITFEDAFVVGDSISDLEAGRRLGSQTIYIGETRDAGLSAPSLLDAVTRIVVPRVKGERGIT